MDGTEECSIKNINCKDIQNSDGYTFSTLPKNKTQTVMEIDIQKNKSLIAFWNGKKCSFSSEVISCDNKSITTRTCSSVRMKFIHKNERDTISESCQIYNITEDFGAFPHTGQNCSTGCILLATFFAVALLVVVRLVFIWRKKQKKKGRRCSFADLRLKLRSSCNNKGNSDRPVDQSDEENHRNYQQEQEQQQQLLEGKSDNTESNSGTTDFCLLDETLSKNDAKGVPEDSGVLPQKHFNGNMGHDPGGGKADTKLHCNGNLTPVEPNLNCDMDNGCFSSHKQGSAEKKATDETAGDKGQTLVDSLGEGINSSEPPDGDEDAHHKDVK